ncbi:MAG TPA: PEP-CTERM sorting domain-containing protein, partial [Bryobacteraceae bacterium]|nr:PEP-CTERM sorting domain-containing protein [Bryobacteraceae bacterium]
CNGGVGVAPGDQYLATLPGGPVYDVSFSVNGAVTEQVTLAITSATDTLGWQLTSGGAVHLFSSGVQGPVSFTPGGDFVLIATVNGGSPFASNTAASDGVSHFAFFAPTAPTVVPEPSSVGLFGFALVVGGFALRKRAHKLIS